MPSSDRINVVLPEADKLLADEIAKAIGASPERGRSAALRYGLRCAAEKLGITPAAETKKKRSKKA